MPELPEVETILRSIIPQCEGKVVSQVISRCSRLRWPLPKELNAQLSGQIVNSIARRGKYLLFQFNYGTLLLHLGMSGYLRVLPIDSPVIKHDHLDIVFTDNISLRLNDSRRFGAVLWTNDHLTHPLLKDLGPEPLSSDFSLSYIKNRAQNRKLPIKSFIMDSHVVVGVGNIYANEALFKAKIHPLRPAGEIKAKEWQILLENIKATLASAIASGGTTLKDFRDSDGKRGYFQQQLMVYGRSGLPCPLCATILQEIRLGGRSSVYCSECQQ